jgi:hypothetical protein
MNTAQPTERQIKETLAASGKTSIKDLVSYGTGKFPTVDAKTIKAFAKEIKG